MKWYITGDIHGQLSRFKYFKRTNSNPPEEVGFILLGDVGANFFLNSKDYWFKLKMNNYGYKFYCIRGNHDARPSKVLTMIKIYDQLVKNYIYIEENFPNIRYLIDGNVYYFNETKALIIGGAYSIDKYYRLQQDLVWHSDEQLSKNEMEEIEKFNSGNEFDIVMSHTAPLDWEPTDLFLNFIDQSTVDKSMEIWLNNFKDKIKWKVWVFGHYHADRIERPYVEMFYEEIEELDEIVKRWEKYTCDKQLDWWLQCSPNFKE